MGFTKRWIPLIVFVCWMIGCHNTVVGENDSAEGTESDGATKSLDDTGSGSGGTDVNDEINGNEGSDSGGGTVVDRELHTETTPDSTMATGAGTDTLDTRPGTESVTDTATTTKTESATDTGAIAETESAADTGTIAETESATDTGTITETESAAGTGTTTETETVTGTVRKPSSCEEPIPIRCGDVVSGDTAIHGRPNQLQAYNCSARAYVGRETVYIFESDKTCEFKFGLADRPANFYVGLLSECISTGHWGNDECRSLYTIVPGVPLFIVVDGVEADDNGPYTLSLTCTCK